MSFFSWLRKWIFQRPAKSAGRFDPNSGTRLSLRKLEDRRVLSVSAAFAGGVLDVAIDTTFTNTQHIDTTNNVVITVDNVTGNVLVNGSTITVGGGTLHATDVTGINVHDSTTSANTINLSGVTVGDGFDHAGGVSVQITGADVSVGTSSITGSGFNDTIHTGTGNKTLVGGGGDDTFIFSSSFGTVSITSAVNTDNIIDLSAVTADITVDLQAGTATANSKVMSFNASRVDQIIGNSNAGTVFEGQDATSTWTIGSASTHYTSSNADITISGFSILQGGSGVDTIDIVGDNTLTVRGGSGADTFNLSDGVHAGNLLGGVAPGADTLNYSAYTSSVTVNLANGTATNVLSITGFENVTGGTGNDNLTGDNNDNVLNGGGGLDVLLGGGGNDTLINGYQSDGQGGTDAINITNAILANNGNNISLVAETINLNANLSTATAANSGSVFLTGPVILGANVSINTNNVGAGTDGNVTFSSTVNSDATARSLAIDAGTGSITATGAIGGNSELASLTIATAGAVNFQSTVTTGGDFTQTAGTGNTTIAGALNSTTGSVSITTGGSISVNGITVTTSDDITLISGGTGSITMAAGSTNLLSGRNVILQAGSAGIGSSSQHVRTDAVTISATSANADIYLDDLGTNVTVAAGGLSAGSRTIFLGDGTFRLGGSNRISDTSTVSLGTDATLDLNDFSDSIGGLGLTSGTTNGSDVTSGTGTLTILGDIALAVSGTGATGASVTGNLALGSATRTVTVADGSAGNDLAISASISGTGSAGLIKAGAGNLVLSGTNTYTGTTTINAGRVTISGSSAIADTGGVTVASGATFALSNDETIGALNGAGSVLNSNVASNRDLTVTGGGTFSGVISNGVGSMKFHVNGPGQTLILSGANTYTGVTTVESGTLQLDGSITSTVTVDAGATLSGSGTVTGSVTSSGTVAPGSGGGGVGILTITGNFTTDGTVAFDVNSGWTVAGNDYDQIIVGGNVDLSDATLTFSNSNNSSAPPVNQLLTVIKHTSVTSDLVDTNGSTTPASGATVTIAGRSFKLFYNGGDGNDVALFEATAPTVVYVSNSAWNSIANGTSVDGDLGTTGTQTAILGVNAFTSVNSALAALSSSGQLIINAGTYSENVSITGTQTLTVTSSAAVSLTSLAAVDGTTIHINGTSLTFGNASNLEVAADIDGTGTLIKQGTGTVILSGNNSYTGITSIVGGRLTLGSATALGSTAAGTTIASGSVLDLNGQTVGAEAVSMAGTGSGAIGALINSNTATAAQLAGAITLTANSSIGGAGNLSLGGTVNGTTANTQSLTLTGTGQKTFTNVVGGSVSLNSITQNNTSGTVEFDENVTLGSGGATFNGYVLLDGMTLTSGGAVTVNASATLGGTATITGNVSSSGTIAPGNGVGILTITGNLTASGTLQFDVNSGWTVAGTDYDQIIVGGTVDLSGATLTFSNSTNLSAPPVNQLLTVIKHNSLASDLVSTNGLTSPSGGATVTIGGRSFKLFYNGGDGNDVVLFEASAPSVVYVSNTQWNGVANGVAVDGDLGTAGVQAAVVGVNAFTSVNSALAALSASGQVIINTGTYAENVSVIGTQVLTVTTGAAVSLTSLAAVDGTFIHINGTSLTFGNASNTEIAADIDGSGNLIKQGPGTLTLSGNNSYSGTTSINGGRITLGSATALGSTSAGTTIATGSVLDLNGQSVGAEALTMNGTGVSGSGALINSNTATGGQFGGAITLSSNSSIGGAGDITLDGTVNGAAANTQSLTLAGTGQRTFTNVVGGTASLSGMTQIDPAATVQFNQNVNVGAGGATFNGNVILDGMTLTSAGAVTIGTTSTNTLEVSGGATTVRTTSGALTVNSTVAAHQNLTLTAGGAASDLSINSTIDGDADVNLNLNAGRTATISADVSATGNGTISVSGLGISIGGGATLAADDQQISLSADSMTLNGNLNAGAGPVVLKQQTNGLRIDLGGPDVTGGPTPTLGLTATELSHVTAGKLTVGDAQSGPIIVSADLTLASVNTLRLQSGSSVAATAGGIVVQNLAISGGGAINFNDASTNVTNLAIATSTGSVNFFDSNTLSIGTVDGINGVATSAGSVGITVGSGNLTVGNSPATNDISATTGISLTVNGANNVAAINAGANVRTTGGDVHVTADNIDLSGKILASGQTVGLNQKTNGQLIDLGGNDAAGTLGLTATELNNVTADVLLVGNAVTGAITISADVAPGNVTVVHLITNSSIQGTAGGIAVDQLAMSAVNDIVVTAPSTNVGMLAVQTGGAIKFADVNGVTIGSVDGVNGLNSAGGSGNISLSAGGTINLNQAVNAGAGVVRLSTSTGGISQLTTAGITASALGVINGGPGDILLVATNHVGAFSASNAGANGAVKFVDVGPLTIGSMGGDGSLFAGSNGLSTTNGDATVSTTGAILIDGTVTAGAATVRMKTTSGGITQNLGDTITAGSLSLSNAGAGHITLDESNDVRTIAISNSATGGRILFRDIGPVTIGTVSADGTIVGSNSGVTTGDATHQGDAIAILANGNLTVNQAVTTTGGTGGSIGVQGGTLNAAVTAGAGSIQLNGTGPDLVVNVAQNAGGSLTYTAQRDILLHSSISAQSNINLQSTRDTIVDSTLVSTNGAIVATAHGRIITHDTLNAKTDVSLNGDGQLTLDRSVDAGRNVSLVSNGAGIQVTGSVDAGNNVDIHAFSTVAASSTLDATNHMSITSGGTTTLSSAADITTGSAGLDMVVGQLITGGDISATDGAISITGPVTLTNGVTWTTKPHANDVGANITVGPIDGTSGRSQDLTLSAGAGDIHVTGNVGALTSLGNVLVAGARNTAFDGTMIADSYQQLGGSATSFAGAVVTFGTVSPASTDGFQFTGQSLQFTNGTSSLDTNAHDVTITANSLTLPTTFLNATGKTVTIHTLSDATSIGLNDASQNLNIGGNQLGAIHSATIVIGQSTNTGGIKIGTDGAVNATSNVQLQTAANLVVNGQFVAVGTSAITANVGTDLVVSGSGIVATDVGDLKLTVGHDVLMTGILVTGAGSQTINVTHDMVSTGLILANAGNVSLDIGHQLQLGPASVVHSNTGDITIATGTSAAAAAAGDGTLFMANGAIVDGGTGKVSLTANGNITLSQVVTANSTVDAVHVTATGSAIINGGNGTTPNITALDPNAVVTLRAVTGIGAGAGPALKTNVSNLDVVNAPNRTVVASGDVRIDNTNLNGVTIKQIDQQGPGSIVFNSQGTIVVAAAAAGGGGVHSHSGSITLSATNPASNLDIRTAIDSSSGEIVLAADNSVLIGQAGQGGLTSIQSNGGNVTVLADNHRGTAGQVIMSDGSVINAGVGQIGIHAQGDVVLSRIVTTNATNAAVNIESRGGGLVNGGNSNGVNIEANAIGSVVNIQTQTGIGAIAGLAANSQLQTHVDTLNIVNGSSSAPLGAGVPATDININETDALTIQQIIQNNGGVVRVTSNDGLTVGRIVSQTNPNSLVSLTSLQSTISNGLTSGTNVVAGSLALRAATGIGGLTPIQTDVDAVAASTSRSGGIQIVNVASTPLSVGVVDGLSGITDAGTNRSDISISNTASISIDAPITNQTTGSISVNAIGTTADIVSRSVISATGVDGDIKLVAGRNIHITDSGALPEIKVVVDGQVLLNALQGIVTLDPNVQISTATGATATAPPTISNIKAPPLSGVGQAAIDFSYGSPGDRNLKVEVIWGDGTNPLTINAATAGSTQVTHLYGRNPNAADPAADIAVIIRITADSNVTIISNGVTQSTSEFRVVLQTPTTGLATYASNLAPPVAFLTVPDIQRVTGVVQQQSVTTFTNSVEQIEPMVQQQTVATERTLAIEILSPDKKVQMEIKLPESTLDEILTVIQKLPDGNYRFQLQEPGEERQRLLLDFEVRQGKVVDHNDDSFRPPSSTKLKKLINVQQLDKPEADAESESRDAEVIESPTEDAPPLPNLDGNEGVSFNGNLPTTEGKDDEAISANSTARSVLTGRRAWRRIEADSIDDERDVSGDAPSIQDSSISTDAADSSSNGDSHFSGASIMVGATSSLVHSVSAETRRTPQTATSGYSRMARFMRKCLADVT